MTKKIYRKFRERTQEEKKEKFGFNDLDLMRDEAGISPGYRESIGYDSLIKEDYVVG